MARGRVDRRQLSAYVPWEELLSEHSSLQSCRGVLKRTLDRNTMEANSKKARRDEHMNGAFENIILAATSEQLRSWVQFGSWAKCLQCGSMHKSRLDMARFERMEPWPNTVTQCQFCTGATYIPNVHDIPSPLLNLTNEALWSLRPLTLFQGPQLRGKSGFRRHAEISKLKWSPVSVATKIEALDEPHKQKARTAYEYLMNSTRSSYKEIIHEHEAILQNGKAGQWLPHKVLLRKHIECVLWPNLYPTRSMCDTEFAGKGRGKHRSVKQSFLAKVTSPVYDYAMQYDLLQYHFDRHVLATFSGRATAAGQLDLARTLKTFPDTPHERHLNALAMRDLNHVLGPAKFMITLAPGAYATTWSEHVLHSRDVTGARVLGDNALEALHIVHVLDQICRGYLFNTSGAKRRGSEFSVFDNLVGASGVLAWAYRLEFQEGAHKGVPGHARRHYHGTGMPHIHAAVWMRPEVSTSNVLKWVRADLSKDFPALNAAVMRVQAPNADEPPKMPTSRTTHWRGDDPVLQHSAEDEAAGVHPYIAPLCLAYLCHSHVSEVRDQGHVAQYMTKVGNYITKSSQNLSETWLADAKSGYAAGLKYLRNTTPSSAEMVNLLSAGSTFYLSCYRKEVSVCAPDDTESKAYGLFRFYLHSDANDGTFAEFLRSYNTQADPPVPYTRLRGHRIALAIESTSPWNDYYYSQWLTMYHQWRGSVTLPHDEMAIVPPRHRWFTACLVLDTEFWTSFDQLAMWFGAHGMSKATLTTLLSMLSCWTTYVNRFLIGDAVYVEPQCSEPPMLPLNDEQTRAFAEICDRYNALQAAGDGLSAVRIRGEAGTGKSRVLDEFICCAFDAENAHQHGLDVTRVLVVTPTGILSDVYRRRWRTAANIDIDTFDGGMDTLQMFDLTEFRLRQYDAWVIDECDYLTPTQWRRLITLAISCPLVFKLLAGDPCQFRPRDDDGGSTASEFATSNITLKKQMRFDPTTPWGKACLSARSARPSVDDLNLFVGSRLLCYDPPTTQTMRAFFEIFPKGLAVAVTLDHVRLLNTLAVQALMTQDDYLGMIQVDAKGTTTPMSVYRGSRVMVTDNLLKAAGVVNGAFGVVTHLYRDCLIVLLDNGTEAAVHKVAFEKQGGGQYVAFPVQHGYSCTLAKIQGHTVTEGLAVWPDVCIPAGGYVAVTRVRSPDKLLWLQRPTRDFFTPAQ